MDLWQSQELSEHARREKAKARDLRKSRWWQTKIATAAACYYCQKSLNRDEVTMDHVLPLSRGGRSSKGNVVMACKDCNNTKKNLTPVEWGTYLDRLQKT